MSKFAERDRLARRVVEAACGLVDVHQGPKAPLGGLRWVKLEDLDLALAVGQLRKHEAAMLEGDRFAPLEDPR